MKDASNAPNAISHKQLNNFLSQAHKTSTSKDHFEASISNNSLKEFKSLIKEWGKLTDQLLITLNQKQPELLKTLESKQIMVLGALEAHLTMAMNAKKASGID